jgi:hypothetical protein
VSGNALAETFGAMIGGKYILRFGRPADLPDIFPAKPGRSRYPAKS